MHYTTQSSGPDSQLFEEFSKQFFPQQNSSKLAPINLPKDEGSVYPESEEDEMNYIKDTLKNLLKAEECAIRSKNQMIESYKSQMSNKQRKNKNFMMQILSSSKKSDPCLNSDQNPDIPLEQSIESLRELENLDKIHQIDDLANLADERIKTVTSFLNIVSRDSSPLGLGNSAPNKQINRSPLMVKEINSEQLSFIQEDDLDGDPNHQARKREEPDKEKEKEKQSSYHKILSFSICPLPLQQNSPKNSSPLIVPQFKTKIYSLCRAQSSLRLISFKSSNLPYKIGWLKKKSQNPLSRWQKRYCKIEDKKFFYYKNEKELHPLGCLDFDLVTVKCWETMKDRKIVEFSLHVPSINKYFVFKNFDKKNNDLLYWTEAIKGNLKLSEVAAGHILLLKCPRFWKDLRICEKRFGQKADTMDLLLFKSKNFLGKLQRSFTRSDYDHVALVLRYGDSEITLLEAESKGVGMCNWKTFIKNRWYNLYQSISWRHLEINRDRDFLEKTEKFLHMVIGNKYGLNPLKLMRRTSEVYDDPLANLEKREFFCSELVACAYKYLNILPKKKACTKYWPGSFSKEKHLQLFGKCRLEEQYLIDFSLHA